MNFQPEVCGRRFEWQKPLSFGVYYFQQAPLLVRRHGRIVAENEIVFFLNIRSRRTTSHNQRWWLAVEYFTVEQTYDYAASPAYYDESDKKSGNLVKASTSIQSQSLVSRQLRAIRRLWRSIKTIKILAN